MKVNLILIVLYLTSCSQMQTDGNSNRTFSKGNCSDKSFQAILKIEKKKDEHWLQLGSCYLKRKNYKKSHYVYNLLAQTTEEKENQEYAQSMSYIIDYLLGHETNTLKLKSILQKNHLHLVSYSKILLEEGKLNEAATYISRIEKNSFEKKWLWVIYYYLNGSKEKTTEFISKLNEKEIKEFNMMKNYIQILKDLNMKDKARELASKYQIDEEQV